LQGLRCSVPEGERVGGLTSCAVAIVSGWVSCTARADDAADDTLPGATQPKVDCTRICLSVTPASVVLELEFAPHISKPTLEQCLAGYVDLDIDRNIATGRHSHIDEFTPDPACSLGVDCYLVLYPGVAELIHAVSAEEEYWLGWVPVDYADHKATVAFDRILFMEGVGVAIVSTFRYCALLGNSDGPTDRIPNGAEPLVVAWPGDFDADGDVDVSDFATFQVCFNGSAKPPALPSCDTADIDSDGDVDVDDYGRFQLCFNGSSHPPAPACIP